MERSHTGRTLEQSQEDLNQAVEQTQREQITLDFSEDGIKQIYIELPGTGKIENIQMSDNMGELIQGERYAVIKIYEPKQPALTLTIKGESGAKMILNMIEVLTNKPSPILSMSPTPLISRSPATATSHSDCRGREPLTHQVCNPWNRNGYRWLYDFYCLSVFRKKKRSKSVIFQWATDRRFY
ncbi:MAG: hypothetical protein K2M46_03090 [Lachnospiraceae bacterium]|nr:hypothetical protein [Lachnospiraceae bacterium]